MLETHLTGTKLNGVYCSLSGKFKEGRRAPAMSGAPLATSFPWFAPLPIYAGYDAGAGNLPVTEPAGVLTQTSDWLGSRHLLTSEPITG